ncbi:MAG: hydratase [Ruminococcaceae bacterium]|nr:hydratase [Oscillospiraceae bacterium]
MVKLIKGGAYLAYGNTLIEDNENAAQQLKALGKDGITKEEAKCQTMAYGILKAHNTSENMDELKIKFDAMASHDITYVGIIQTARASGLEKFPIPYVLTNCHNSLCAVGGTINEDDHVFGLSAAEKYGGIYVPAHIAVIHSYMREMMSGCGRMILGSDSHTRYGALGTMAIGEGGPELVKQLLCRTYDIKCPEIIAVHMTGKPQVGVGPQDVALAIIGAVFESGFVKNKVLEFVGDGIANLPIEFRNGIDVMTTETTCLSSIWITDDETKRYFDLHGRADAFRKLKPGSLAYYDGVVEVDLSRVEPMIALPFHPSNTYTIKNLIENAPDILRAVEKSASEQLDNPNIHLSLTDKITPEGIRVDQGVIAGCAGGTFDNLMAAADILAGQSTGCGAFSLSAYPASQPAYIELLRNGAAAKLMAAGVTLRTAFCGPCFGAGDVPANGGLSIRHSTRNFPNREGSKPGNGQIASVALMDARSIAATARNGGILTPATELEVEYTVPDYHFDSTVYDHRVYKGFGEAKPENELKIGPNIADWPVMSELTDDLLLRVASVITDPVTTTDELIPSGETSSYRSNPLKLSEFALSRKDPAYVGRAKAIQVFEKARLDGADNASGELADVFAKIREIKPSADAKNVGIGSVVYANKPGDGSAREQAASCQKVLGGWANIAMEYATKRYRSNLINWGMLPFLFDDASAFSVGDHIYVPDVRETVAAAKYEFPAYIIKADGEVQAITLKMGELTDDERTIILCGCLINYYKAGN